MSGLPRRDLPLVFYLPTRGRRSEPTNVFDLYAAITRRVSDLEMRGEFMRQDEYDTWLALIDQQRPTLTQSAA